MRKLIIYPIFIIAITLLFNSCFENDYPSSLYDPDETGNDTPTITNIDPNSYCLTGAGDTITITGTNFSNDSSGNAVYFGTYAGTIVGQTSTQLKVIPPVVDGTGLIVEVSCHGAYAMAEYDSQYELERAAIEYGGFTETDIPVSIAVDDDENIYVLDVLANIFKITPEQEKTTIGANITMTDYSAIRFHKSDNQLLNTKIVFLYNTPLIADSLINGSEKYPDAANYIIGPPIIQDFDIDQNNNFYFASKYDIIILKSDTTKYKVNYPDISLLSIKVYNGYVYVVSEDKVYRNEIQDALGTLGATEEIYDFSSVEAKINSITFSSDGKMVIGCTDDGSGNSYPIYTITPVSGDYSGSNAVPLYPTALNFPCKRITWGEGNYLYYVNGSYVVRVNMRSGGTNYYGRE